MKLLIFTSFGSMIGGANKALLSIIKFLNKKDDIDIAVIVGSSGELCENLDLLGVRWSEYHFHKISGVKTLLPRDVFRLLRFQYWMLKDSLIAKRIACDVKEFCPDVIYINDITPYVGAMTAQMLNIPYVWHYRSLVYSDEKYILGAKNFFYNAESIIAISHSMYDMLSRNDNIPSEHLKLVYDGVPMNDDVIYESAIDCHEVHILQCGRLTKDKGHIDAIKAIIELANRKKNNVYLHIVGRDPSAGRNGYVSMLNDLLEDNSVTEHIIFEGQVENMPQFRKKMTIELMCSDAEPFGWVTVEGMRSGLVVIGSNTGATPEIIQDGITGLLYEKGNYIELADKIEKIIDNPNLAQSISKSGQLYANSHFGIKENSEAVEAILRKAGCSLV